MSGLEISFEIFEVGNSDASFVRTGHFFLSRVILASHFVFEDRLTSTAAPRRLSVICFSSPFTTCILTLFFSPTGGQEQSLLEKTPSVAVQIRKFQLLPTRAIGVPF